LVSDIKGRTRTERMFDKGELRRIFGLQRDEIIGGWRKLHALGGRGMCIRFW
jgi:hypothetical protein